MRALGQDAPTLLSRLEQAIGAEGFLRLIKANGTLFELLSLLASATPAFRKALLDRLDADTAARLLNKTIAAGRSIESFHLPLRALNADPASREQLQVRFGVEGWWRLIGALGTLHSLTEIVAAMDTTFRRRLIGWAVRLSTAEWKAIIERGWFTNASSFVAQDLRSYPPRAREAFRDALTSTADALAAKASWTDLDCAADLVDPGTSEGKLLQQALCIRLDSLVTQDLIGAEFQEATHGLAVAWHKRPDLRSDLAASFWSILPEPHRWPTDEGEIDALPAILDIARSPMVARDDALRLLRCANDRLNPKVCAQIQTGDLAKLAWSLAALAYDRGAAPSLLGALSGELAKTLAEILSTRVAPKGPNCDKLAQLGLAGVLALVDPQETRYLAQTVAPLRGPTRWLAGEALDPAMGFVPALFALEGMAVLKPWSTVFGHKARGTLLARLAESGAVGPAVDYLRARLTGRVPH